MNIVLHQPEIPANTGNIGRTCVATGTVLHLIEPLGFRLTGKELRRAGMDYWEHLDVRRYMNFEEYVWQRKRWHSGGHPCGARRDMHPDSDAGSNKKPEFGKQREYCFV